MDLPVTDLVFCRNRGSDSMENKEEKNVALGARLEACAGFVRRGGRVADIGTDHAYLPIWLVQNGAVSAAYASDINEEPIMSAVHNIHSCGLDEKIKTFTANGLDLIPPDGVDDIVIAGMGGDNIAAILSRGEWLKNARYRLILQPMSRASRLREYLYSNGYHIIAEKAVCEADRVYTVICTEYSQNIAIHDEIDIYAGRLDASDPNAAALLKKQAGILLSVAEGCAARGDYSGEAHCIRLAEKLLERIRGGIGHDECKGSI